MMTTSDQKGKWRAGLREGALASGKSQADMLLRHDSPPHRNDRQLKHRVVNPGDMIDEALEEASPLARRLPGAC